MIILDQTNTFKTYRLSLLIKQIKNVITHIILRAVSAFLSNQKLFYNDNVPPPYITCLSKQITVHGFKTSTFHSRIHSHFTRWLVKPFNTISDRYPTPAPSDRFYPQRLIRAVLSLHQALSFTLANADR